MDLQYFHHFSHDRISSTESQPYVFRFLIQHVVPAAVSLSLYPPLPCTILAPQQCISLHLKVLNTFTLFKRNF